MGEAVEGKAVEEEGIVEGGSWGGKGQVVAERAREEEGLLGDKAELRGGGKKGNDNR